MNRKGYYKFLMGLQAEWPAAILPEIQRYAGMLDRKLIAVDDDPTGSQLVKDIAVLSEWDVDILTIGQYLQPSRRHLPIERYYTLEEFAALKIYGLEIGFKWVESAPLVRSSYHAAEQVRALSTIHRSLNPQ